MTRSKYMQSILASTYPMVAIEAISGGFDGAWERLIASKLRKDYIEIEEATNLINSCAGEVFPLLGHANSMDAFSAACNKAAYLVTSSEIEPANDDLQNIKLGQEQ